MSSALKLLLPWLGREDNAGTFADGEDLVGGNFRETLDFLSGRPLYFDEVHDSGFA